MKVDSIEFTVGDLGPDEVYYESYDSMQFNT